MRFRDYIPYYKRNLKVAGPIVLSQVGVALTQLVDTFMVGKLGTTELAAVSLASSIALMGFLFVNGLLMGATPIVGQLFATADVDVDEKRIQMGKIFQNQILLSVISSVLMLGLLYVVRLFLYNMGQDVAVVDCAIPYYVILIISILPNTLFMAGKQLLEGLGNTSVAMAITIVANIVNIVFNYFLIYGNCGFPQMGVIGAGLATFIARVVMAVALFIMIYMRHEWRQYCKEFRIGLFDWRCVVEILRVGFPIAVHILVEMSAFSLSGIMMGWLGAAALASHQIAAQTGNVLFMVVLGISAATTIRVSHQYGAKDYVAMRMAANASIHLCLFANMVMGILLVIFRKNVVMLFSSDPEVIRLGSQVLIMAGIFQLSDGMQAVGAGILRGLKDVKVTMYVAFLSYLVINLPLGYIMAFVVGLGAPGVWMGFIGGLSVAAILFRIRYVRDFQKIERNGFD
ncbi:MAG: MATE family efflux transporter [Paludibacteraceae bacterium]|nr:MATE family efflux transporter [Paludibacteraceae bacterium]